MDEYSVGDSVTINTEEAGIWDGWHGTILETGAERTLYVKCQRFNRTHHGSFESTTLRVRPDQIRMRESRAQKDRQRTEAFERWGTE